MNNQFRYVPSAEAKEKPFTIKVNGVSVGVGGGGWVHPSPPALPYYIREATQEEYEILFNRGHTKSIERHVEQLSNSEDSASIVAKPNSSSTPRNRRTSKKPN